MRPLRSLTIALLALLALVGLVVPSHAAPPQPAHQEETAISGNAPNKLPTVATSRGRVYVSWSAPESANLAERAEESGQFSTTRLGSVEGNTTYFNTAVTAGADGTVHFVWISGGTRILHRNRPAGQGWSGDHVVADNLNFANAVSVAVRGNNEVFVAWRDGEGQLHVANSTNSGNNWQGRRAVPMSEPAYAGTPRLAAGASGVFLAWTGAENGQVFIGEWNGNNFPNAALTPGRNDFFNPTISVAPNGNVYAAWRSIERGVFYAERRTNGDWGVSNVFRHPEVAGPVAVTADGQNNVHLAWSSIQNGSRDIWYAIKTPTEDFSTPIVVSRDNNGFKTNVDIAASVQSGYVLAHIAWESFVGGQYIRYARVRTPLNTGSQPTPTPSPVTPTPTPTPNAPVTGTFDFANDAFRELWTRTDSLVKNNAVSYSWIWGPSAFTQGVREYYVQSPGQSRLVQYFDKSRMEINQPDAPRGPFYVTNGRLADELITGQLQVGDAQYEQRTAARISVAGDPSNQFPQYRDLQAIYRKARPDDHANQLLYRATDGSIKTELLANANNDPSMLIVQRVAGLGVPRIFWDFMNRPGQVIEGGRTVTANPLYDWRYVIGEPLTEAYWVFIKVGGIDRGVLVQAFERRVLTYTPTNAPEFQVEMGNIGRHYFEWRYGARPQ